MRDPEKALHWIVQILNKHKVPFQITGGLAAIAYGSGRELADIDIDIPGGCFERIVPDLKDHTISGPERYKDEKWDLFLLRLSYAGVDIEITDAQRTRIFDSRSNEWVEEKTGFTGSVMVNVLGIEVPVIPKEKLIAYKKMLGREVDMGDIGQISTNHNI